MSEDPGDNERKRRSQESSEGGASKRTRLSDSPESDADDIQTVHDASPNGEDSESDNDATDNVGDAPEPEDSGVMITATEPEPIFTTTPFPVGFGPPERAPRTPEDMSYEISKKLLDMHRIVRALKNFFNRICKRAFDNTLLSFPEDTLIFKSEVFYLYLPHLLELYTLVDDDAFLTATVHLHNLRSLYRHLWATLEELHTQVLLALRGTFRYVDHVKEKKKGTTKEKKNVWREKKASLNNLIIREPVQDLGQLVPLLRDALFRTEPFSRSNARFQLMRKLLMIAENTMERVESISEEIDGELTNHMQVGVGPLDWSPVPIRRLGDPTAPVFDSRQVHYYSLDRRLLYGDVVEEKPTSETVEIEDQLFDTVEDFQQRRQAEFEGERQLRRERQRRLTDSPTEATMGMRFNRSRNTKGTGIKEMKPKGKFVKELTKNYKNEKTVIPVSPTVKRHVRSPRRPPLHAPKAPRTVTIQITAPIPAQPPRQPSPVRERPIYDYPQHPQESSSIKLRMIRRQPESPPATSPRREARPASAPAVSDSSRRTRVPSLSPLSAPMIPSTSRQGLPRSRSPSPITDPMVPSTSRQGLPRSRSPSRAPSRVITPPRWPGMSLTDALSKISDSMVRSASPQRMSPSRTPSPPVSHPPTPATSGRISEASTVSFDDDNDETTDVLPTYRHGTPHPSPPISSSPLLTSPGGRSEASVLSFDDDDDDTMDLASPPTPPPPPATRSTRGRRPALRRQGALRIPSPETPPPATRSTRGQRPDQGAARVPSPSTPLQASSPSHPPAAARRPQLSRQAAIRIENPRLVRSLISTGEGRGRGVGSQRPTESRSQSSSRGRGAGRSARGRGRRGGKRGR